VPLAEDGSWWRVEVRALPRRNRSLRVYEADIPLRVGTPLRVFHSHRFTRAALLERLRLAGLACVAEWQGADGEEGLYVCETGEPPPES
jgi:hypothetical protein